MTITRPRVATLESLIIDTFTRFQDGVEVPVNKPDQLGGAGTYAIIGARVFLPPERLAMIVDFTPDTLPRNMRDTLESFGNDMWAFRIRDDGNGTTRAVNRYDGEKRGFEYLTPPRLLLPHDLLESRFSTPLPSWIHMVSFPDRTLKALAEIGRLSAEREWAPGFIWEPEPPCCVPDNLDVFAKIVQQVDVVSPNHTEAMAIFNVTGFSQAQAPATMEYLVRRLVALRPRIGAVLRAGSLGCCYALTKEIPPGSVNDVHLAKPPCVPVYWVPAFWTPEQAGYQGSVVDPTGAGNAFCGGLMAALSMGQSLADAIIYANVAASFIIEQHGLPRLAVVNGEEVWNGDHPDNRVRALRQRVEGSKAAGGVGAALER